MIWKMNCALMMTRSKLPVLLELHLDQKLRLRRPHGGRRRWPEGLPLSVVLQQAQLSIDLSLKEPYISTAFAPMANVLADVAGVAIREERRRLPLKVTDGNGVDDPLERAGLLLIAAELLQP